MYKLKKNRDIEAANLAAFECETRHDGTKLCYWARERAGKKCCGLYSPPYPVRKMWKCGLNFRDKFAPDVTEEEIREWRKLNQ